MFFKSEKKKRKIRILEHWCRPPAQRVIVVADNKRGGMLTHGLDVCVKCGRRTCTTKVSVRWRSHISG